VRALRSLVPMSVLTISAGGAAGPEAPLVTTCGSLAGLISRKRELTARDARCLTIAGMAAGFTVLFGTPIGSALFALEILHRRGMEYHEALLPSIVGALSGYGVFVLLTRTDLEPIWHIPGAHRLHGVDLLWAIGAGVVGALIAVVYTGLTLMTRRIFRALPTVSRPVLGGLALAGLAFWTPYALTFGEAQTGHVLAVQLSVGVLAVALIAKLIASTVTLASGWPGGFIIPLFFVGAAGGQLAHHAFSGASTVVMCSALMAAGLVGVTKTVLGTTLVVTAMTGLQLLPTILLAAVVALLLTSSVRLIHTQRERSDATLDEE
jgi:H+/Cl- antiporter ClcA